MSIYHLARKVGGEGGRGHVENWNYIWLNLGGKGLGGQEMRRMKGKIRKGERFDQKTILVDGARMKDKSVHDVKAKNVENNPNKKEKN